MLAYLQGTVAELQPMQAILLAGGIGYELQITLHTYEIIKDQKEVKLFTHLQIREDAWVLYGFAQAQERATFRSLLSISGVGAATARIILSSLSSAELAQIVAAQDAKMLEKVKGIGAKTAQRILLELKGKLVPQNENASGTTGISHNTSHDDALNALINLGIAKNSAQAALAKVTIDAQAPVEELIKQALKHL